MCGELAGRPMEALALMAGIRQAFDPLGILNPGAVLAQR
jgi:FAD/FMN-containing dehydrogenase